MLRSSKVPVGQVICRFEIQIKNLLAKSPITTCDSEEIHNHLNRLIQCLLSIPTLNLAAILKDLGIHEYENRVVNQLLEFVYRYVSSVLGA